MYIPWKKHTREALLLLCLPLVVAGCSGGNVSDSDSMTGGGDATVISGSATKGPIEGATVEVYRLLPTGLPGKLIGFGTSGSGGSYQISVPAGEASGPLAVTVTGNARASYISETTGEVVHFTAVESFSAVVDNVAPDQQITVSPLTEAAFQKLPQILAEKAGTAGAGDLAASIDAANARIGALFNVSDILAPPTGDPTYQAALQIVDRMVEDSKESVAITDTNAVMVMLNQALADVQAPAFERYAQVFTEAAEQVKIDSPEVAALVDSITAQATEPPPEPDFGDVSAPTAPAGLSATAFAITGSTSSIVLSWHPATDNTAVAGYDLYRDGTKIATVRTPGYTDPLLTSNVGYAYSVVAFDGAGNRSGASSPLSVTPLRPSLNVTINGQLSTGILGMPQGDIYAPSAPANLTATTLALTGSTSSVTLSWSAASDAVAVTGYEVFRNGTKLATVTATGYSDASVGSSVTVTYFIIAFDAAGNRSIAGNQLLVTPNQASLGVIINGQVSGGNLPAADILAPTAPANLSAATAAISVSNSSVALSWSAASDAVAVTGYEVFRNGTRIGTVATTAYSDPSLVSNLSYSYTVKAFDAAGNRSAASDALSVTPNQASLGVTISGQVTPGY